LAHLQTFFQANRKKEFDPPNLLGTAARPDRASPAKPRPPLRFYPKRQTDPEGP
jgi:hypothetical protein